MSEMSPKQDRWLFVAAAGLLSVSLVVLSNGRSEGKSSLWPWKSPAESGKKAPPVAVEGPVLNLQDSFAKVAAQVKPAVVSITATHIEKYQAVPEFYFGDPMEQFFREFHGLPPRQAPAPRPVERRQQGLGSGVIIDPRGYVLTNEHVVRGADELSVTLQFPEEKKFTGKVVGADPRTDLAVIKISSKNPFPHAALGDSDKVRVGDWAIAIGSPFGLEQTLTVGVISAVRQTLSIEGANYTDMLQTDAAINRGNSGGPLLNVRGEVVGINSAIYAPTGVFAGIGFAIPVNRVKEIMDQLIEKGRVVRGWLGVEILSVNDVIAQQFGLPRAEGVMINNVLPGSPAEKAGLRRGDVVVSVGGQKTPNQEVLMDVVGRTAPNTRLDLTLVRDGREIKVPLTTGEMPKEPQAREEENLEDSKTLSWEGAQLVTATPDLLNRSGAPAGTAGVVVVDVSPGGLAESLGLQPGDVVVSINRQKTPDTGQFDKAVKKLNAKTGVLMDVNRRGRWLYLSYREGQ